MKGRKKKLFNIVYNRIVFFSLMVIVGSLFTLLYLAVNGNAHQIYTDIVIEYTSIFSSNKSSERSLLYILIFGGSAIYLLYYFVSYDKSNLMIRNVIKGEHIHVCLCFLGVLVGTSFFIFTNVNQILLACMLCTYVILIVDRELLVPGMCFFFLGTYAVIGLYRLYVMFGGTKLISEMMIALVVTSVLLLLLVLKSRKSALFNGCLIEQLIIPTVLLIYVVSKYRKGEEFITIRAPFPVSVLISILIIIFVAEAVIVCKKNWNTCDNINKIICYGSCVSIVAFNRFSGTGAIMPTDMHHPFENIIGYFQIFELGQIPFTEYMPVSGMYSVIQGIVFQFFGYGQAGNYYITQNVFYLFAVMLIVALLRRQIEDIYIFIISLTLCVIDYNRIVFILPIMLLLMLPKLVEKKNLWLKAWYLTSLFHGLYYPVFGAAVCVAFLPMGLWQAITYVRSGQLKKDIKNVKFWFWWGMCMMITILCMPCLLGTYKHIKAMAGQSICADGISRFGQLVPSWFLTYLSDFTIIRIAAYYVFTFMIPAALVWVAFALTLSFGKVEFVDRKIKVKDVKAAVTVAALVIMPIISYSYTIVRLDIDDIYARSAGIVFAVMVLLIVSVCKYLKNVKIKYVIICIALFVPSAVNTVGFYNIESKLSPYYTVPEDYIYIEDTAVEKLGKGFISQSLYDSIISISDTLKDMDKEQSYFGMFSFGYYYLCDIKGDGSMEAATVKGYDAAKETIDVVRRNDTIIGTSFNPLRSYYLYYWLLTSGEYIWNENDGCFLPSDGKYTSEEIRKQNQNAMLTSNKFDIGKNASSLGLSMETLMDIFSSANVEFMEEKKGNDIQLDFRKPIYGQDADFMYVEFADMDRSFEYTLFDLEGEKIQNLKYAKYLMKKNYNPDMQVVVEWLDENNEIHSVNCVMGEGKLLIPLGVDAKWLLNNHENVSISVLRNNQKIIIPEIVDIQFLKLREVN